MGKIFSSTFRKPSKTEAETISVGDDEVDQGVEQYIAVAVEEASVSDTCSNPLESIINEQFLSDVAIENMVDQSVEIIIPIVEEESTIENSEDLVAQSIAKTSSEATNTCSNSGESNLNKYSEVTENDVGSSFKFGSRKRKAHGPVLASEVIEKLKKIRSQDVVPNTVPDTVPNTVPDTLPNAVPNNKNEKK
ncbi:uncharacterized protein LOC119683615 [Teleopsis dalmanni]|uniref:uncharacterized protein LOC119683615 n=1 Tax=Teleopsis dalmanni TaxID=139649 RepID=UPI0018CE2DA8|nr:uncharacterized protein LOC119683615 [Teleopsis dalmanni]